MRLNSELKFRRGHESFDQMYSYIICNVMNVYDHECSPRGQKVRELIGVTQTLNNPRKRILHSPNRLANMAFGVGEFLWYWAGRNDLKTMLYYNKRMSNFSDDGQTLNSAYGYRIRKKSIFAGYGTGDTQWNTCIKTLTDDPDSRRAVLLINVPEDERQAVVAGSKDVPCTLALQFFVRDNRLDLHATMRSNDVVWGLTYDLFSFTMLQECMMLELKRSSDKFKDLELGRYHHTAGSIHIYENHFEMAEKICNEPYHEKDMFLGMEPIHSLDQIDRLVLEADNLSRGVKREIDPAIFSGGTRWMVDVLNAHREKRTKEEMTGV